MQTPTAFNPPSAAPLVRRLMLADFRSYASLDLKLPPAPVVALVGENGAGKTNVLEALSLLTAGRGLRRADLADCARVGGHGGFAVSVEIDAEGGGLQLGTSLEPQDGGHVRRFRVERAPVSSARAFADHIRIVWLTPAMDGLFSGPPGDRRRFVDRLVLAVDAGHGARVNALERALRNRNRLLEERAHDTHWLDAAEREVAEIGVAVAAARRETIERLAALIEETRDDASPFPWAGLSLEGDIDRLVTDRPALQAEDAYRALLRDNRRRDAAAGRTLIGPQGSDLVVRHGPKDMAAAKSSTGEQKALLVGLVLAHAQLVRSMSGVAPLVLLDEVAAHFDPRRRASLFARLVELGGQVWMTGADPAAFGELSTAAHVLHVTPGRIAAA